MQVFSGGKNIALGGKATQSSTANGGDASHAIDGKTDGAFGSGTQTHTEENDKQARGGKWTWAASSRSTRSSSGTAPRKRQVRQAARGLHADVLDGKPHEVFKSANNPAPAESAKFAGRLRRARLRSAAPRSAPPSA